MSDADESNLDESDESDLEEGDEDELETSEYWMLECWLLAVDDFKRIASEPEIDGVASWISGMPFEAKIPEPILLEWEPRSSGPKKSYYAPSIPLMTTDVLTCLREAGVDNIDAYKTQIRDTKSGEVDTSYRAINIVGLVEAADLGKSDYDDPSGDGLLDMDFDSLAIDQSKAHGMKLFRLAECVTGIVIHNSVKEHLESKGGFGLTFVHPSEWIG